MAELAVATGDRIVVLATAESTIAPTRDLLAEGSRAFAGEVHVARPLQLAELRPGKTRPLTSQEIGRLYQAVGL